MLIPYQKSPWRTQLTPPSGNGPNGTGPSDFRHKHDPLNETGDASGLENGSYDPTTHEVETGSIADTSNDNSATDNLVYDGSGESVIDEDHSMNNTDNVTSLALMANAASKKASKLPAFPENLTGDERAIALRDYIHDCLDDEKAEDIVMIDLEGKSEIADVMIIASGRSARHVSAIASKVHQAFKKAGATESKIEGQPACDWVLVDAGDIIVHLFRPEVRDFYNLERIWSEAARAPIGSDAGVTSH